MKHRILCALAVCAGPTLAFAGETTVESANYACADNKIMRVVFVNGADGSNFAILQQMDEMIPLKQKISASGAIYKALGPDYTYTLLTKGKQAFLEDDKEERILSDCSL